MIIQDVKKIVFLTGAAGLVQYVDINNPIYYIDPNLAYIPDYPDIKVIKATVTKGMEEFKRMLIS